MEAIPTRLEAISSRLEAITIWLEAIASNLEAVTSRLEAIATRLEAISSRLEALTIWLEAIAIRLEAIASRLEAIATWLEEAIAIRLEKSCQVAGAWGHPMHQLTRWYLPLDVMIPSGTLGVPLCRPGEGGQGGRTAIHFVCVYEKKAVVWQW